MPRKRRKIRIPPSQAVRNKRVQEKLAQWRLAQPVDPHLRSPVAEKTPLVLASSPTRNQTTVAPPARPRLSPFIEHQLLSRCASMARQGKPWSDLEITALATYAIREQYQDDSLTLSIDWLYDFYARYHYFTERLRPLGNCVLRIQAVHRYLDDLQAAMDEHSIPPQRIYSLKASKFKLHLNKCHDYEWHQYRKVTLVETMAFDPESTVPAIVIAKSRHSLTSLTDLVSDERPVRPLFNSTGNQTEDTLHQWLDAFDAATRSPGRADPAWRLLLVERVPFYTTKTFLESAADRNIAVVPMSTNLPWLLPAVDITKLKRVYQRSRGPGFSAPGQLLFRSFLTDYPRMRKEAFDRDSIRDAFNDAGICEGGLGRERASGRELGSPNLDPITEEHIYGGDGVLEPGDSRPVLGPSQLHNRQPGSGSSSGSAARVQPAWEKKLHATSCLAEDIEQCRSLYTSDRRKVPALHARWSEKAKAALEAAEARWIADEKRGRIERQQDWERRNDRQRIGEGQVDVIELDSDDSS